MSKYSSLFKIHREASLNSKDSGDCKKFTSAKISKTIEENSKESSRNWMLWIFKKPVKITSVITTINFSNRTITQ